jgi:hypothetical protein
MNSKNSRDRFNGEKEGIRTSFIKKLLKKKTEKQLIPESKVSKKVNIIRQRI